MRQCVREQYQYPVSSLQDIDLVYLKKINNDCAVSCLYYCSYQVCTVSYITVWNAMNDQVYFSRLKTLQIFYKQGLQNGLLKPIRRWLREKSTSGNGDRNFLFFFFFFGNWLNCSFELKWITADVLF